MIKYIGAVILVILMYLVTKARVFTELAKELANITNKGTNRVEFIVKDKTTVLSLLVEEGKPLDKSELMSYKREVKEMLKNDIKELTIKQGKVILEVENV